MCILYAILRSYNVYIRHLLFPLITAYMLFQSEHDEIFTQEIVVVVVFFCDFTLCIRHRVVGMWILLGVFVCYLMQFAIDLVFIFRVFPCNSSGSECSVSVHLYVPYAEYSMLWLLIISGEEKFPFNANCAKSHLDWKFD